MPAPASAALPGRPRNAVSPDLDARSPSPAAVPSTSPPLPAEKLASGRPPRHNRSLFGPYKLGRTLGEGEFGKVKLAVHLETKKEFAIKLIKKENIEQPSRRAKLMREISILQAVEHRFIVKVYEVIETKEYIGMIMDFASGGELFEHILAHRYLKERDACRFFAQLLAGVAYLHGQKIVHRDLKLENLLLDGRRNVIITDFGFANRSSPDPESLLLTSCGSPCYAAPELVISDGYVGEAADIWSCGVILYAMLCGYLPFDDDPNNPDGDNINLLYKYILETELDFPEYVEADARDLLKRMLVPDPRYRANMREVMAHRWLQPYAYCYEDERRKLENGIEGYLRHTERRAATPEGARTPALDRLTIPQPDMDMTYPTPPSEPADLVHNIEMNKSPGEQDQQHKMEVDETAEISEHFNTPSESHMDMDEPPNASLTPEVDSHLDDAHLDTETIYAGNGDMASVTVIPLDEDEECAMDEDLSLPPIGATQTIPNDAPVDSHIDATATDADTSISPHDSAIVSENLVSEKAYEPTEPQAEQHDLTVASESLSPHPQQELEESRTLSESKSKEIPAPQSPTSAQGTPSVTIKEIDYGRKSLDVRRAETSATRKSTPSAFTASANAPRLPTQSRPQKAAATIIRPHSTVDRSDPPRVSINAPSVLSVATDFTAMSGASDWAKLPQQHQFTQSGTPRVPHLRYHSGPIDQRALTSKPPGQTIAEAARLLECMGMEVRVLDDFKIKVVKLGNAPAKRGRRKSQRGGARSSGPPVSYYSAVSGSARDGTPTRQSTRRSNMKDDSPDTISIGNGSSLLAQSPSDESMKRRQGAAKFAQMIASFPVHFVKKLRNMARYGSGYNKGFGPHEAAALAAASSASVSTTSLPGTSPDSPVRSASISTPTSPSGRRSSVALTIASGSHSPYIHPPYAASHDSVASTMHTSETAKDIRFTVEVQKIKNLPGLFVVEFKRLKGDVWDFKRLYQEAIVGMENVVGVAAIGRR